MSAQQMTTPTGESRTALVRRARRMNRLLADTYPDAHCELDFTTPLELLVATILSAQCTDRRVNLVTPVLFARYPTAADYAAADRAELEELIRSTGFFRNKASAIIGLGQALVERYDGEVPGRLRRPRDPARRRAQDRQRRARQRLRRPGHHGRHALRAPRASLRLDRRRPTRTRSRPRSGRSSRAATGPCSRTMSSGTGAAAATRRSLPVAHARWRGCARPSAPARPTPSPRPRS